MPALVSNSVVPRFCIGQGDLLLGVGSRHAGLRAPAVGSTGGMKHLMEAIYQSTSRCLREAHGVPQALVPLRPAAAFREFWRDLAPLILSTSQGPPPNPPELAPAAPKVFALRAGPLAKPFYPAICVFLPRFLPSGLPRRYRCARDWRCRVPRQPREGGDKHDDSP